MTLVAVAIAGLLRWLCDPFLGDHLPFVTFFVGVAAAAWLGGLRPALLATGLGFVVAWYFFVPPRHSFILPSGPHLFGLGVYFIVCLALAAFGEAMHVARRHTELERLKTLAERERFQLAAEAVNGIIYEYDITTGHVERQRGLYEVLGYRGDEVPPTAAWWWEQIHPDDHEPIQKRLIEFAGNSITSEYRVRHKDGHWLHIEDRAVLLRGDDGQLLKMIGCTVDVTARKRVDAELQRRETFTSGVLGSITDGFFSLDRDWRITYINAAGERFLDRIPGDLIGKVLWDEFPGTVGSEFERVYRRVVAGRVAEFFTAYYPNFDRWYELTAYPAPEGLSVYFRDITDRKRDDEQLRYSEQLHRVAFEQSPTGMVYVGPDGRFIKVNPAMCEITGYPAEELVGMTVYDLTHLDDRERDAELLAPFLRGDTPTYENDKRYVRKDGGVRWVSITARMVTDAEGRPLHTVGVVLDITERKRAEAAVRLTSERLTLAVKCSQVVLFQQDLELRYIWHRNPELGLKFSDFIGKRDVDLMDRAADAAVTEGLKREVIRTGVGQRQEILVQIQGVDRHYDLLVEPQRDAAGLISGVTCAAIDITERKRAETAQRETERDYRALADASLEIPYRMSADWSTMLPLDGRELFASSDRPLADWGWVDQYLPRDEHARVRQTISDAIAGKNLFEMEHRVLRLDESTGWVRSRSVPILDEKEEVIAWFGAASDITTRKQAEEERRLLASIVENSRDFIGISDTHGNLVYGNRAAMELVGVPDLEQVRRSKIIDYFVPEQRPFVAEVVLPAVIKDGRWIGELTFQHFRTGAAIPVWYDLFRVDDSATGQPINFATITRDLTEQKRAQEALRASEERRRLALDAAELGTWHVEPATRATKTDARYRAIFGTTEDWTDYFQAFAVIHPDDLPAVKEAVATATRLEDPTAYAIEYRIVHPDGSLRWVLANGRASFEGAGPTRRGVSFDGTVADITERKRAEEGRRLLASIVENSRDFIGISDTHGNPVHANRAAMELVGFQDLEQVRRSKIVDYFVPEQRQFVAEVVLPAVIKDGRWVGELTFQHFVTGATIPVLYDLFRVDDPATGQPINFATITRDLTERKRDEERLRQSEARFRAAINAVSDIVWTNDAQGQMAGEQAAWGNFTGQDQESYQGYGWSQAIHPDDAQPTIDAWNEAVAGKQPFALEHRLRRSDGQWRLCSIRAVPILNDRGEITEWVGVHTDITEQRELHQAMLETDRRKDEFLATLAHELRNPLAPIRNGLQIMKLSGGNPDVVEKSLGMMERQVGQMTHLIDDLMDLSRISGGKILLQKARLLIADVVQDAVDTSRPLIEERGHDLVVDVPPEPLYVDADRTRLAQVFGNLLNNAAKYTETGGRLRVAVERHGGDVVVTVEDNGVGISPHMLTRVFDMFSQVDRSLEKSQGGLGIGLNIVKRLAEMHDGSIVAESDGHGAGSRFVVRLPMALSLNAEPRDEGVESVTVTARRRILVVDDNRDAAISLALVLEVMGHELQTAHDGLEALDLAAAFRPDLVLLDIGMPKLNGYDTARRIREQTWGKSMVLVALTGWGQDEDKRKSQEAGFDAHLVKPVDPTALDKLLAGLKTSTA